MKRFIAIVLCTAMLASMAACSFTVSKPDENSKPGLTITTSNDQSNG